MSDPYESRPTFYNGVMFRSRLEAHWACFFDLAEWKWEYEPIDLVGWTPTFRVVISCSHSACTGSHALLVDVKPFYDLSEFAGMRCMAYPYGSSYSLDGSEECIPADASAAFGINPDVCEWEMAHGAGAGVECVWHWVSDDVHDMWNTAGNILRGLTYPVHQGSWQSHTTPTVATNGVGPSSIPTCDTTRPWANGGLTSKSASLAPTTSVQRIVMGPSPPLTPS